MANVATHTIEINGQAFRVRIGWNAVRRLEEVLGIPAPVLGQRMVDGHAGLRELGLVFWAGLETARVKDKSRPMPWSIEEVGDLIDEVIGADGFFDIVYPKLLLATTEAFPSVKKKPADEMPKTDGADPLAVKTAGDGTISSPTPPSTV